MIEYKIVQDMDPINPREFDNLGTMVCFSKKYQIGDRYGTKEEYENIVSCSEEYVHLPIYAYIHSGITINSSGFSCPWDSGLIGFIYVEKKKVLAFYQKQNFDNELFEKVKSNLIEEIETYDKYLNGQVFGYEIKDGNELVDSCYGFYSEKDAESQAKHSINYFNKNEKLSRNI